MLWSVHTLKLHELFLHWHPVWQSTTSPKQSLASRILRRYYKQPIPMVHSRQKILVTLSSRMPNNQLRKTYNISTATSEATLTQQGHSLSQTRYMPLDMKDEANIINQDEGQFSNKRNQVDVSSDSDVIPNDLRNKKLKSEGQRVKNFNPNTVSAFSVAHSNMQSQSNTASTSKDTTNVIIYDKTLGLIDPNIFYLQKKAEWLTSKLSSLRIWEMTPSGVKNDVSPGSSSSGNPRKLDFKLMSYNILAQNLLEENIYLYHNCDKRVLNWDYRCSNLLREMVESESDIICLQEMQDIHYEGFFKPELSKIGYNSVFKKRTGYKNDGCAIFYRRSKFALDTCKEVEFFQPSVGLLDRDNVALIAVFQPILENGQVCDDDDDPKLCVATTHLLFNPRRGDIKLAQLQMLLAELDKVSFKKISSTGRPIYNPTIVCGDMNSEPYSPLYQFVTQGHLNYYGLQIGDISGQHDGVNRGKRMEHDEIQLSPLGITTESQYKNINKDREGVESESEVEIILENIAPQKINPTGLMCHPFNLLSAYDHHNSNGMPYITTQHRKACCTVDYIFYSNSKKCSPKSKKDQSTSPKKSGGNDTLTLLGTYRLLSYFDFEALGGLPNAAQSSDHLSLIAKFRLKIPSR